MKVEKVELNELLRCYATKAFPVNDTLNLFYASEEEGYPCYSFSGENFENREIVWENGGGCMSIIPVPNTKDEFFAITDFYLKVTPSKSKLVWGKKVAGQWVLKDLIAIPYLHRFEVVEIDDAIHFIGATIADNKQFKDDWELPGSIYTGIFPKDLNEGLEVEKISTGYFRNHGLTKHFENGREVIYLSSDQGTVRAIPPFEKKSWTIEKVMDGNISEIAIGDIDNDGYDEIITIEPFHGNTIKIYRMRDGEYEPIYTYDNPIDFAHSLVFCTLKGKPTFLAGIRRMDCELVAFTWDGEKIVKTIIDQGGGPANLFVYNEENRDLILSANHTENKAVVYVIK